MIKSIVILVIILIQSEKSMQAGFVGNPIARFLPCENQTKVNVVFETGKPPDEENQYDVHFYESMPIHSRVYVKFDSEATVTVDEKFARISANGDGRFVIRYFKPAPALFMHVKGPPSGVIPYITSLNVNEDEQCSEPKTGYLDGYILGYQPSAETHLSVPDESCGRRKVVHTELIVNGQSSKAGDWPWHAAIYWLQKSSIKYKCGGSVIGKTVILTAAHCASSNGVALLPEIISVTLGKYNLIGGDTYSQEREVHKIILHEDFAVRHLDNDIALLKLKTEITYNDYIQPICLWYADAYKKLPTKQVFGTVVGWGFDQNDELHSTLEQITIPKVSETTCIKTNPLFFSTVLNKNKFCAGWANGTSACNGDSGGGFAVFVPDVSGNSSPNATGAWYIRGIVSLSVARKDVPLCDPNEYSVFTDLAQYRGWLRKHEVL